MISVPSPLRCVNFFRYAENNWLKENPPCKTFGCDYCTNDNSASYDYLRDAFLKRWGPLDHNTQELHSTEMVQVAIKQLLASVGNVTNEKSVKFSPNNSYPEHRSSSDLDPTSYQIPVYYDHHCPSESRIGMEESKNELSALVPWEEANYLGDLSRRFQSFCSKLKVLSIFPTLLDDNDGLYEYQVSRPPSPFHSSLYFPHGESLYVMYIGIQGSWYVLI